jgi:cyclic pyranopterin phosphate synthase
MKEILTYEEIVRVCTLAAQLGIKKIRLTGGEPLVRFGIEELVRMIHEIPGIEKVTLTTNGILLKDKLPALVDGGLQGVNISLDTLVSSEFRNITGRDQLNQVLDSIRAALDAGIQVKVNTVLLPKEFFEDTGLPDAADRTVPEQMKVCSAPGNWLSMLPLPEHLPVDLRFIELMPIGEGKVYDNLSSLEVMRTLRERYPGLKEDHAVHGSGPAVYYEIPGFKGSIGLIQAVHGKFCSGCNRIRISATGQVKPCLCYADTVDLRSYLRNGADDDTVREALAGAIYAKPMEHCFENLAAISEQKKMVAIGG